MKRKPPQGEGITKWSVRVHAVGHGQWMFIAGPRSGTGYPTKQAAREAGEAALVAYAAKAVRP